MRTQIGQVSALAILVAGPALAGEHKIDAFAGLDPTFTTNAFFAEDNPKNDGYLGPNYGVQFAGPLSESFSYYGRVFLNDVRFDDFAVLNNDVAAVSFELRYTNGPWLITGRANPQWSYTQGFDELQVALYDFYLIAQRTFKYRNLQVKPKVSVSRLDSTSEATERSRVGPGVDLNYKITENKSVSLRSSAIYQIYDDPVGGRDRDDWRFGVAAGFNWTLREGLDTGVGIVFTRNKFLDCGGVVVQV